MKPISQSEGRRLRKRVSYLESAIREQKRSWSSYYPEGTILCSADVDGSVAWPIHTARKLGFGVVVTSEGNKLVYRAVKLVSF